MFWTSLQNLLPCSFTVPAFQSCLQIVRFCLDTADFYPSSLRCTFHLSRPFPTFCLLSDVRKHYNPQRCKKTSKNTLLLNLSSIFCYLYFTWVTTFSFYSLHFCTFISSFYSLRFKNMDGVESFHAYFI